MSQKQHFLGGEADNWFKRNIDHVNIDTERSQISFLTNYIQDNNSMLEIGCSFGANINTLAKGKTIKYVGIDPSEEAIKIATAKFPQYEFKVGTADDLNFEDESFDVVFFGFCLYLVDRRDLIKVISEANRVLKPGGKIFITDFSPNQPYKNEYKYVEGLFSYKMNYENLFLAFPGYSLLQKNVHITKNEIPKEDDRIATCVLYKSIE